ncbi:hypothetical protein [Streptomyces sp. NBC_00009]|uniref:hypothetical protein n=1 Tax=Streptomyces sp. NBC_00009 TaxID=2975620 RepID=UPI003247BAD6
MRSEGWQRVVEGAWLEPGLSVGLRERLLATQWLTPRLVASHSAAAWLWGIEVPCVAAEFTDPERRTRRQGPDIHNHPLDDREITTLDLLRCTTVDRTLADLLRTAPQDDAIMALDSALTWRRVPRDGRSTRRPPLTTLDRVIRATGHTDLRGGVRARRRLHLADARSGSPAETLARLRMAEAGLHPQLQAELVTPEGRSVRPDFLFPRERVAVEIEGYAYHGTREAHRRDLARFNQLQLCPEIRTVLRFTARQVQTETLRILTDIRRALAAQ